MTQKNKNILIADDHYIVQGGLKVICNLHFPEYQLYFASNFEEITKQLEQNQFDLMILDLDFEEESSLNFISRIFKLQGNLNVLIYSGLDEKLFTAKITILGAKGFLTKMADTPEIVKAIQQALNGKSYFSEAMISEINDITSKKNPLEKLSKRELEIMTLYAKGYGNLEITNKLEVKKTTISTYKKRIFDKLGITTLKELIEVYNLYNG